MVVEGGVCESRDCSEGVCIGSGRRGGVCESRDCSEGVCIGSGRRGVCV